MTTDQYHIRLAAAYRRAAFDLPRINPNRMILAMASETERHAVAYGKAYTPQWIIAHLGARIDRKLPA